MHVRTQSCAALHTVCFSAESLAIKRPLIETLLLPCLPFSNIIANSVVEGLNFLVRLKIWYFVSKIVLLLREKEKNPSDWEKYFANLLLNAKILKIFWVYWKNLFKQWKVRRILENRIFFELYFVGYLNRRIVPNKRRGGDFFIFVRWKKKI